MWVPAALVGYITVIEWLMRPISARQAARLRPWLWLLCYAGGWHIEIGELPNPVVGLRFTHNWGQYGG